jgi:hypothetical protein
LKRSIFRDGCLDWRLRLGQVSRRLGRGWFAGLNRSQVRDPVGLDLAAAGFFPVLRRLSSNG